MVLLDLVKHLRQSLLDDTGGSNVSWEDIVEDTASEAQLRWSNEELTRFINEAEKQACRSALLLKSADPTFSITVVAGTATYSLDSRIIKIKGIYLSSSGRELIKTDYEDLLPMGDWRSKTGIPTHYIEDIESGDITLYPKPSANDTLNLLVYRLPMVPMSWDLAEIDTPDIKEEHQLAMLNYAAFLAYNKDEANTFDPQRAEYYRQLFVQEFSNTSAYSEIRQTRTRNRTVRYRDVL